MTLTPTIWRRGRRDRVQDLKNLVPSEAIVCVFDTASCVHNEVIKSQPELHDKNVGCHIMWERAMLVSPSMLVYDSVLSSCFVKSIKKLQSYIPLWFERTVWEWSWEWSTWASGLFNLKRSCGCTCVHLPSTYFSIYIKKIVKQLHTVGFFFNKNSLEFFCRSRSSLELACYHNLVGAHTFPLPRRILHKRNQCHDDIMTVQHSGLHHPWS